jgi:hypothetical protein
MVYADQAPRSFKPNLFYARPHGKTRLTLDGFPRILVFEYFSKISYFCAQNKVKSDRSQVTSRYGACWVPRATNTHSQCVMLIAFPLQQLLHEAASMLKW